MISSAKSTSITKDLNGVCSEGAELSSVTLRAACARMLVVDLLPFIVMQDVSFRHVMAVSDLCAAVRSTVQHGLGNCKGGWVHMTTDVD